MAESQAPLERAAPFFIWMIIVIARLTLPKRPRCRPSAEINARYREALAAWCEGVRELASTLDFKVSSRGWCYILEEHGLAKGDFDSAQRLINDCRKSGDLPLNICSEDDRRTADNLELLDRTDPADQARDIVDYVRTAHRNYTPQSFWDGRDVYVEVVVEKVDLKSLFVDVCEPFHIPVTNVAGWNDLSSRARMMERFAHWEDRGAQCVLLYCGDHDPGGLLISDFIRSNMDDMSRAVGWSPDKLIIERFGLNSDFIEAQGLTWIENLSTSSGTYPLNDPRHPDHKKPYVQNYLRQFGARKCEANALVVRPEAGRELCRQAILRYLPETAPADFEATLELVRAELSDEVRRLVVEMAEDGE